MNDLFPHIYRDLIHIIDEVLQVALLQQPTPLDEGTGKVATPKSSKGKAKEKPLTAH